MTNEEQFEARYWHLAGIPKIAAWQAWKAATNVALETVRSSFRAASLADGGIESLPDVESELMWQIAEARKISTTAALERAAAEVVLLDKKHWFSKQSRFAEFLAYAIRALKDETE